MNQMQWVGAGFGLLFTVIFVLLFTQEDCHRHYVDRQRISGYTNCVDNMRPIPDCQTAYGTDGKNLYTPPAPRYIITQDSRNAKIKTRNNTPKDRQVCHGSGCPRSKSSDGSSD